MSEVAEPSLALSLPWAADIRENLRERWERNLGELGYGVLNVYSVAGDRPRVLDESYIAQAGGLVVACLDPQIQPIDGGVRGHMRTATTHRKPIFLDISLAALDRERTGLGFDISNATIVELCDESGELQLNRIRMTLQGE
jgi:hypothetical protein